MDEKLGRFRRDPEADPDHLENGLADAIEGAAYVPGGDEADCVGFFCVFQGVDEEEGGTIRAMVGAESVLKGVKKIVGFPGVADAMCQYAGPSFLEDFK